MEKKFSLEMGKFHQHGMLDPSNHQVAQKIDESNLTSSERLFFKLWSSKLLNDGHKIIGHKFSGKYLDCGTMNGYIKSSMEISKL